MTFSLGETGTLMVQLAAFPIAVWGAAFGGLVLVSAARKEYGTVGRNSAAAIIGIVTTLVSASLYLGVFH